MAAAADVAATLITTSSFLFIILAAADDADALLRFKSTVVSGDGATALSDWTPGAAPCVSGKPNWTGVICDNSGGVYGLQLEGMNLVGPLDLAPLADLKDLRTLSFMNNKLAGSFPDSIKKLGALKSIYLSNNRFSGGVPAGAFDGMGSLKKVHLSSNNFTGEIPSSMAALPKLVEVRLDGNHFTGAIPELRQPGLKVVNLSNNDLAGPIPESLRKIGSFAGNKALCGPPLGEPCPPLPSQKAAIADVDATTPPSETSKKNKLSTPAIVVIVVVAALILLAGLLAVAKRRRRCRMQDQAASGNEQHQMSSNKVDPVADAGDRAEQGRLKEAAGTREGVDQRATGKLVFLRGGERFEMQDLLKASAEVLGDGGFGSCYKATLDSSSAVVVKRFREMNRAGREDFAEHMRRLGRLSHPNLLPLLAYYFRMEEKLLVSSYVANGSLAQALHGNGDSELQLNWLSRLRIIKGVASGLAYLYQELPMLALPHGHLKSSTVLLGVDDNGVAALLTDYALSPMIDKAHAPQMMAAYNSPELFPPTQKCDVWSLGILILELLTGRSPDTVELPPARPRASSGGGGGGAEENMVRWVKSVVREEWSIEVFDMEMKGTRNCEGEMLKLLQIGLDCCERDAGRRPSMSAAASRIKGLKEAGAGEGELFTSGEIYEDSREEISYSSRDDFSFSENHGSR